MNFQTITLMSDFSAPVILGKHYAHIVCRLFCVSLFLLKLPALERTPQSHVGLCNKRSSSEQLQVKTNLGTTAICARPSILGREPAMGPGKPGLAWPQGGGLTFSPGPPGHPANKPIKHCL